MNDQREAFLRSITERKQELFELLSDLVKIDSQNFGESGKEADIAEFIAEKLEAIGLSADVYSPMDVEGLPESEDYWDGHNLENRPNVTAIRPGSGAARLMLAAHSDTVKVGDIKNWTVPPFSGLMRDGKIFGRGACDDKYAIAAALYLLTLLRDAGIELPYDLLFTAYCDEERGGGNGALAACMKYPCDDIVNLDCKNFEIWASAAGGGELRAIIRSEKPLDGCEPMLNGLCILRDELLAFGARRREELKTVPLYRDTIIPDTAMRFIEMRSGDGSAGLDRAHIQCCYYSTRSQAEIDAELAEMEANLNARLALIGLRFERFERPVRHFRFAQTQQEGNRALDALIRAGKQSTGRELTPCGSCLSDLSLFIKYGTANAFSFGVGRPFSAYGGAHQEDEFIECDRLLEFAQILGEFLLTYGE